MSVRGSAYDVVFYVPWVTPLLTERPLMPPGGAETQIFLVARALAGKGARVCLVAFDSDGIEMPRAVEGVDIVVRPHYRAHQRLVGKAREALRIRSILSKIDARVVVTRIAGPHVGLAALSAKLRGRAFVYSSANVSDFDSARLRPKRRDQALFRIGVKLADSVVVQTEEQVEMCERAFGKKPTLIRSVAELGPQQKRNPEAFLWIGRLVWYKRPAAFIELAKALPNIPFRMVGVSATDAVARQVAAAAADVPNVELLPPRPRPQLMELIDRAVAVVNTADFEGMPNIFLEGWSRGVPALALTHDPDGVISRHGLGEFANGSQDALIVGAEQLWRSRLDRRELAERCRRYIVEHHSAEVVAAHWLDVLEAVDRLGNASFAGAA